MQFTVRQLSLFTLIFCASCSHQGVGEGRIRSVNAFASAGGALGSAKLSWTSGFDAGMGELRAVLPDGKTFTGPFAQIRALMETDTMGPHLVGWSIPAWGDDPWFGDPPSASGGVNSTKMIALLKSPNGEQLRCRFELRKPDSGIAGGAYGQCQASNATMTCDVVLEAE